MTVVIASTYRQAVLAAAQLGLETWRWAHRPQDIQGVARGSEVILAQPALGQGDPQYWECRYEAARRFMRIKEVWT